MPGSSATTTTRPPLIETIAEFMNGSAATFKPTCFIDVSARRPANDTPSACSYAVFSLVDHVALGPPCFCSWRTRYSRISVDGVPG